MLLKKDKHESTVIEILSSMFSKEVFTKLLEFSVNYQEINASINRENYETDLSAKTFIPLDCK
tara:strand:+ start:1592 stop:1780 length:189 start_codon:yes stop_codon:yes gene_type:complete